MIYFHAFLLVSLAIVLVNTLRSLRVFSRPEAPPPLEGRRAVLVSVLIPARNEETRLGPCLESLLAQTYPHMEIIVLDDNSTDGTGALAEEMGFDGKNPGRRLIRGRPLPEGWTGKAWACRQLAAEARGDYLLFTDADTFHSPDCVAAMLHHALVTRADLLSAWPRQVTGSWSERMVIPLIYLLLLSLAPQAQFVAIRDNPERARRASRGFLRACGAANGQFMLFRRVAYKIIGGHESVRGHLVEDVALGREIAVRTGEGLRLVNCDGSGHVRCRMYENFGQLWEGFSKNLRPAFERAELGFWAFGIFQILCFVLPFGLLLHPASVPFALGEIGLVFAIRLALARRFHTPWFSVVFHVFGHSLALLIALNSWRLTGRKGVTWKGRRYEAAP